MTNINKLNIAAAADDNDDDEVGSNDNDTNNVTLKHEDTTGRHASITHSTSIASNLQKVRPHKEEK